MHIVIALITAVAGLIWALNSLQNAGVNLNDFNPFTWLRRKRWEQKLGTKPMHALTSTMDAAALLIVAVAQEKDVITRDSKIDILNMFENDFGISRSAALELFSSSSYMLNDTLDMATEVRHVLKPNKEQFEQSHIDKLLDMLTKAAALESAPSPGQISIITAVKKEFEIKELDSVSW